jgi:predicted nucleotidyltransferase
MFEQDRLLMRLQQRVLSESAILVCFLSGSYGRRTQDPYSDLDIALVFASDAEREIAYAERKNFAQSLMPYVPAKSFDALHIRPFFHIVLFSNGAKVDFRYETQGELRPSFWDHDIKVIKDTDGWGEQFQNTAAGFPSIAPRPKFTNIELVELDNRFWITFMDVYRLLLRGDNDKPFPVYLELLSFTITVLRRLLPEEDPARKAQPVAHFDNDTKETRKHMRTLLSAYLEARTAVVKRYNLAFMPDQLFEDSIVRLVDRTLQP